MHFHSLHYAMKLPRAESAAISRYTGDTTALFERMPRGCTDTKDLSSAGYLLVADIHGTIPVGTVLQQNYEINGLSDRK